jgi:hypothetical protein
MVEPVTFDRKRLIKGCRNAKEKACKYISILSRLASA